MKNLMYCALRHRSCPLTGIDNYDDLKNKIHRRNMLIKSKDARIKELEAELSKIKTCVYDKFGNKIKEIKTNA